MNASTPQTSKPVAEPGAIQVGQASGSYTSKGETVELKYAYAGRGERFGMESIIVLVTDKPIPACVDDNDGNLRDGKYSRKVKFVAAIVK